MEFKSVWLTLRGVEWEFEATTHAHSYQNTHGARVVISGRKNDVSKEPLKSQAKFGILKPKSS